MPEKDPRWKQIEQKLDQNDVARIVERQVNQLDRDQIDELYRGVGHTAYDPVALLKMVLYQYLKGRQSPAIWYEEAKLNEALQWLGRGNPEISPRDRGSKAASGDCIFWGPRAWPDT